MPPQFVVDLRQFEDADIGSVCESDAYLDGDFVGVLLHVGDFGVFGVYG